MIILFLLLLFKANGELLAAGDPAISSLPLNEPEKVQGRLARPPGWSTQTTKKKQKKDKKEEEEEDEQLHENNELHGSFVHT